MIPRRACAAVAIVATLAAGCNAIFDIHEGKPWPAGCTDELTIDDMEDGDGAICEDPVHSDDRHGAWFTVGDDTTELHPAPGETFVATLIPGGRDGSRYAARMTGSGVTREYARMGFNLNVKGLANMPYNASGAGGLTFWMKSDVAVGISVTEPATIPGSAGGTCADSADALNCDNPFHFFLFGAPEPDRWVEYHVPFSALSQWSTEDANGNSLFGSVDWSPTSLVDVQFLAVGGSFDVWVDDIRFYPCPGSGCAPTCTEPALPVPCAASGGVPAGCWPEKSDCATVGVLDQGFTGLWGSGPGDVWTVGGPASHRGGTVGRWDGTSWSITDDPSERLGSVWGSGPDDVWAVGERGTIFRWDGAAWSPPVQSGTRESLTRVWGSAADDVWAVGHGGIMLHWNGVAWSPVVSATSSWLVDVWGSGRDDVWAVGVRTDVVASTLLETGVMVHWDGSRWRVAPTGAPQVLRGLWGSGPDDAWGVGQGIVHWNGAAWTEHRTSEFFIQTLNAVWGNDRDDVWAVGTGGLILHWNGARWRSVQSGTVQDLKRVWGSGPEDVWAVGSLGTVVHWNGTSWSVLPVSAVKLQSR